MSKGDQPPVTGFNRGRILAAVGLFTVLVVLITLFVGRSRKASRFEEGSSVMSRVTDRTPPARVVIPLDEEVKSPATFEPDMSSVIVPLEPYPVSDPVGPVELFSQRQREAFGGRVSPSEGQSSVSGRGGGSRSSLGRRFGGGDSGLPTGGVPPELADIFQEIERESQKLSGLLGEGALSQARPAALQIGASVATAEPEEDRGFSYRHRRAVSEFVLDEGSLIPGVLVTEINSELPGRVVARVTEDVRDSRRFAHLLIPRGSKLLGDYDSDVRYGQNRVGIGWHRVIFPNGDSVDFSELPGVDAQGRSGVGDRVNHHLGKVFGSALLMSVISAGFQAADGGRADTLRLSASELAVDGASEELERAASSLLRRNLSIPPTIRIRAGQRVSVLLTGDVVFAGPYQN